MARHPQPFCSGMHPQAPGHWGWFVAIFFITRVTTKPIAHFEPQTDPCRYFFMRWFSSDLLQGQFTPQSTINSPSVSPDLDMHCGHRVPMASPARTSSTFIHRQHQGTVAWLRTNGTSEVGAHAVLVAVVVDATDHGLHRRGIDDG